MQNQPYKNYSKLIRENQEQKKEASDNLYIGLPNDTSRAIQDTLKELLKSTIRNNIQQIGDWIVFDSLLYSIELQSKKANIRDIEKHIYQTKNLSALLGTILYKSLTKTILNVYSERKKKFYEIETPYKERKRTKYYIEFPDATHMLTITYRNINTDDIFQKIQYNQIIIDKINKGLQRMRAYFRKYYNARLKYIGVREIQSNGTLHEHILIKLPKKFREDFQSMIEKLHRWFETDERQGIDLKYLKTTKRKEVLEQFNEFNGDDEDNAVRYVAKYMNKYSDDENIFEVKEGSKIYATTKEFILYNSLKRRYRYSYKEKPKIIRYPPSKISKSDIDGEYIFKERKTRPKSLENINSISAEFILKNFEKKETIDFENTKKIREKPEEEKEKYEMEYYYFKYGLEYIPEETKYFYEHDPPDGDGDDWIDF